MEGGRCSVPSVLVLTMATAAAGPLLPHRVAHTWGKWQGDGCSQEIIDRSAKILLQYFDVADRPSQR
ncbi:hypothetical protein HZH68_000761 [Vespula germanica]|uniref:Uncharacterized protein n=1 Tax=Vespula germanica TaxID=30212 RepID=A0A834NUD6_VESGE|nr:hypothetical protein HZH68_000761 [Vespula germanica]